MNSDVNVRVGRAHGDGASLRNITYLQLRTPTLLLGHVVSWYADSETLVCVGCAVRMFGEVHGRVSKQACRVRCDGKGADRACNIAQWQRRVIGIHGLYEAAYPRYMRDRQVVVLCLA
jgi:hypothetical protein